MDIVTQIGEKSAPSDEQYLKKSGVDVNPKVEKVG
jgi:hypothetical protein